jgi:hypothetical protein
VFEVASDRNSTAIRQHRARRGRYRLLISLFLEAAQYIYKMTFKDSPANDFSNEILQGTEKPPRRYGYDSNGSKKRILLNAFDMNGIGHIR